MGRGGMRYGAGRPGWRVKAEHTLRLDVRDLSRRRLLGGGSFTWTWRNTETGETTASVNVTTFPDLMRLSYRANGTETAQTFTIERTPCPFGGSRPWLRCWRCSRRVAVLFLRGDRFACRSCGGVAYASQSEDDIGRAWRTQTKLERRLDDDLKRPKGMRQATYEHLVARIIGCERLREKRISEFLVRLGALDLL